MGEDRIGIALTFAKTFGEIYKVIYFGILIDAIEIIFIHEKNKRRHINPKVYGEANFFFVSYAPF